MRLYTLYVHCCHSLVASYEDIWYSSQIPGLSLKSYGVTLHVSPAAAWGLFHTKVFVYRFLEKVRFSWNSHFVTVISDMFNDTEYICNT